MIYSSATQHGFMMAADVVNLLSHAEFISASQFINYIDPETSSG